MAGPSRYKFNNAEDPNDAGALRNGLSRTKIGLPEPFGGDFASKGISGVEGVSNGYGSAAT